MLLVELKGETLSRKKKKKEFKKKETKLQSTAHKEAYLIPYERETFLNSPRLGDN